MGKGKDEYETLIRSSILFSLDKETQAVAYQREALKMVEYLYLYLLSINAEKYSEYGLEITQTAKNCIKNYLPESGDFLNYFNSAFAKEYRKAYAINKTHEKHGAVHIPEQDQRIINKYIKLAETQGIYEFSSDQIKKISEVTGIRGDKIKECIQAYQQSFAQTDQYIDDDGEEGSLFDLVASDTFSINRIYEESDAIAFLKHIDEVFKTRQQRQKPLLSKLLTSKIVPAIIESKTIRQEASQLTFFDEQLFISYRESGNIPSAREIATMFELSEQSVSRAYRVFISFL